MTLVAIHQPNFFPWLGYFDKIRRSDVFVILDDVQFPKKGGSWSNRVQISRAGNAEWLTVPVERNFSGYRTVEQMRFLDSDWRAAINTRLKLCYGGKPFAKAAMDFVTPLLSNPTNAMGDFNFDVVTASLRRFGLGNKKVVRSSEAKVASAGTARLIELTKYFGGTAYLSGGGAQGYQDAGAFDEAGVELVFQNFVHPVYEQGGDTPFVPGLSLIDALANVGPEAVSRWFQLGGTSL